MMGIIDVLDLESHALQYSFVIRIYDRLVGRQSTTPFPVIEPVN